MQPTRRALPFLGARLETGRIVLYSLGTGLLVGVFGTLLAWLLERLQDWLLTGLIGLRPPGLPSEGGVLQSYNAQLPWLLPILLMVGLAGVLFWRSRQAQALEPDGVNAAIAAFHQQGAAPPAPRTALELLQGILAVGVGAPTGREGVFSSLAMLLAPVFTRLSRLSDEDRRLMFVATLAAMLGLALRAPLAAAVLAVEMLYRRFEFEIEALMPAVLSSVVAFAVYGLFRGFEPLFELAPLGGQPPAILPAFFVLGLLEALCATGFVLAMRGLREAWGWLRLPLWVQVAAMAGLLGGLAMLTPLALGDGLGWMQLSLSSFLPLGTIFALLALRVAIVLVAGSMPKA
jgi:chloride channel protein, CIC family